MRKKVKDFEKIENNPIYSGLISFLKKKFGDPLPKDLQRYFIFIHKDTTRRYEQVRAYQLVDGLYSDALLLKDKPSNDNYRIFFTFYVNLHCFLTDYKKYYEERAKILKKLIKAVKGNPLSTYLKEEQSIITDILKHHSLIKKIFSSDELEFIEYQRHNHTHFPVDKYSLPKLTEFVKPKEEANINNDLIRIRNFFKRKRKLDKAMKKQGFQEIDASYKISQAISINYSKKLLKSSNFTQLKILQFKLTKSLAKDTLL